MKFFTMPNLGKLIHFEKIFCERVLSLLTSSSENCSDYQMALGTDHSVDRTFLEPNLSPTEQFVKDC